MPVPPLVVANAFLSAFIRVGPKVEKYRPTESLKRLAPDIDTRGVLNHEMNLQAFIAKSEQISVIAEIEELFSLGRSFSGKKVDLVVAVEMDFEGLASRLIAREKLGGNVRSACSRNQCRKPVFARDQI